jgi:hypothetical protein
MKLMMLLIFQVILSRDAVLIWPQNTTNSSNIHSRTMSPRAASHNAMNSFPPKPPTAAFPFLTCADRGGGF